jgi:carbohydrate-selective porin OprB
VPIATEPSLLAPALIDDIFEAQGSPLQPKRGDRSPTEPDKATEKEREWIGQPKPFWDWSHLTGDWANLRNKLEEAGVTIGLTYTFDGASVFQGGQRQRSLARGLFDANLTIDTEPLLGLKGGTLFAQYYFRHGRDAGEDVGGVMAFSNIDEERLSRAEEVWYEQKLGNEVLRIKLGQVDANSEFAFADSAGEFIHSSAGFSPSILNFPTYPNPALSFNLFIYPIEHVYLGGGIYSDNFKALDGFKSPFVIGEVGLTHKGKGTFGPGKLSVGAWHDADDYDRAGGGTKSGTSGFFLVAEQQAWRENPDREDDTQGLSFFTQFGWADATVSDIKHHVSFGASAKGLIPGRDDDDLGVMWTWVNLNRKAGAGYDANESSIELFYRAQITPALSLKPTLQWIQNPGGVKPVDDALVGTLRATLEF